MTMHARKAGVLMGLTSDERALYTVRIVIGLNTNPICCGVA
ncbi:hypothetical protein BH23CHL1_BH23CHL1_18560 [soil metagenome]